MSVSGSLIIPHSVFRKEGTHLRASEIDTHHQNFNQWPEGVTALKSWFPINGFISSVACPGWESSDSKGSLSTTQSAAKHSSTRMIW